MSKSLEALARRVANDPFFLASVLAAYARSEHLDDAGLAETLGCSAAVLTALRLCRAPRPAPRAFQQDVDRLAERFGVDADRLAEVVRYGQALPRLQAGPASAQGFLMAAREEGEAPGEEP